MSGFGDGPIIACSSRASASKERDLRQAVRSVGTRSALVSALTHRKMAKTTRAKYNRSAQRFPEINPIPQASTPQQQEVANNSGSTSSLLSVHLCPGLKAAPAALQAPFPSSHLLPRRFRHPPPCHFCSGTWGWAAGTRPLSATTVPVRLALPASGSRPGRLEGLCPPYLLSQAFN